MPIKEADLPLVLPASVARVQQDGRPTKPLIDNEFATRHWYLQNAVDLDQKITTVKSETDDAIAEVHTQIDAATSATSALASTVTTHTAQIAANSAAVTNETTARVDADSALAGQFSTLSTTVSGNTASISTLTASVNGVAVKYGVQGTINGVTGGFVFSGIQQLSGGALFGLEIDANVTINGNLIVTGTVTTPKVAYSSINVLSYQILNQRLTFADNGQWQNVISFTVSGGGDNAYAYATIGIYTAMYIPTNATGQAVFRVWSDNYGDMTGNINPAVASVDNSSGNGAYAATSASFIRPTTVANDVFRLQINVSGTRIFFVQNPTAMYVETRKR